MQNSVKKVQEQHKSKHQFIASIRVVQFETNKYEPRSNSKVSENNRLVHN